MRNEELATERGAEAPAEVATTVKGLCRVCAHGPTCIYVRNPEIPILNCEEFAGYEPSPERVPERRVEDRGGTLASTAETGDFKGLCVNCDGRFTCIYPKPEGGVWRCEEYE